MVRPTLPPNQLARDKILARLRESFGRLVSYDDLIEAGGVPNKAALAVHVNILRENHAIRCVRNTGFILVDHDSPVEDEPEDDDVICGAPWRPEHFGDPLLDALRLHHPELA